MQVVTLQSYQALKDSCIKLAEFEALFTYPLQNQEYFRISHAPDYSAFFSSIGNPTQSILLLKEEKIIASLSAADCDIYTREGNTKAIYFGDLKIDINFRNSRALWKLGSYIHAFYQKKLKAFCVVMGGTNVVPSDYTGRLGFPLFKPSQSFAIIALDTKKVAQLAPTLLHTLNPTQGKQLFTQLAEKKIYIQNNRPNLRSLNQPQWLYTESKMACGRLEDTLIGKRLFHQNGHELLNAHLASFIYNELDDAINLLQQACLRAFQNGLPLLFSSVKLEDAPYFANVFGTALQVNTHATVFTAGVWPSEHDWIISTSEI
jgi:hypothetical protein